MGIEYKELELGNINNGAVPELFQEEWTRVLADIDDIQKKAEFERSVTIEIKVVPDEERGLAAIKVSVKSKLAAPIPSLGYVHLSKDGDEVRSYVNNPVQDVLDFGKEQAESGGNA